MAAHLKAQGAFGIRMGRRWSPAAGTRRRQGRHRRRRVRRLGDLPPTERTHTGARVVSQLTELAGACRRSRAASPPASHQHVFWIPLAGRTEDEVLAGMNQLWRRNIKKAAKGGRRDRRVRRRRHRAPS